MESDPVSFFFRFFFPFLCRFFPLTDLTAALARQIARQRSSTKEFGPD
jgi:hypothetical protein